MALVDSLLSAIVRADGDALVMHVGERPYVVVGTQTINISTHGLNLDAMTGMLAQLLPAEAQTQLAEYGAVEHRIPQDNGDRFTVVAARDADDIWIEIRRRRAQPAVAEVIAAPPPAAPVVEMAMAPPVEAPIAHVEPPVVYVEPAVMHVEPMVVVNAQLEPVVIAAQDPTPAESIPEPEAQPEPVMMPVAEPEPEPEPVILEVVEPEPELEPVMMQVIEEPEPAAAPDLFQELEAYAEAAAEPEPQIIPEPEPQIIPEPEPILAEAPPEPVFEPIAEPIVEPVAEPFIELIEPDAAPIAASIEEPEPLPIAASIEEPQPMPIAASIEAPELIPLEPAAQERQPIEQPAPIAASIELPEAMKPGVVLPMTRTVRIEVPPRTSTRAASGIDRLLRVASARGASALFLTSESRPWIRIEGDLRYLDSEPALTRADVESAILEIAPESGHESIGKGEATEWIAEFADVGRIRCTTFSDHRGPGMLLRMIATRAATAEQLGLAREVQALATEPQGLVLVAGPRASGKSTLISALVDLVNRQRAEFVITLERQIRLVHDNKSALVSQREIRGGAEDSVTAARAALRESPDVLVVDDLVSQHMVPLLLTAASEGLLVFVSITAPSTADAVQRFVELAPPEMRKAVQAAMAESFRGAVAQVLLKKAGGGLIAAREVLLATAPVTRVINEGQLGQLPLALESGRKHGMVSFTDALADSVRSGTVDLREAFRKAPDRNRLLEALKRDGIDTSVVERLA